MTYVREPLQRILGYILGLYILDELVADDGEDMLELFSFERFSLRVRHYWKTGDRKCDVTKDGSVLDEG